MILGRGERLLREAESLLMANSLMAKQVLFPGNGYHILQITAGMAMTLMLYGRMD